MPLQPPLTTAWQHNDPLDKTPLGISNELYGGIKVVQSIGEMLQIPVEHMQVNYTMCFVTTNLDLTEAAQYILSSVPLGGVDSESVLSDWTLVNSNYTPLPSGNVLIREGFITTNGLVLTVDGSQIEREFRAVIDGNVVFNNSLQTFNVDPTTPGNYRKDLIVLTNTSSYLVILGNPGADQTAVILPNTPANSIAIGEININDSGASDIFAYVAGAYVAYSVNQNLSLLQRLTARNNIQAVSRDTNDSRTGTLDQNNILRVTRTGGKQSTFNGDLITLRTGEDGTASSNMLDIRNTLNLGGITVQKRGSTTITGKGDSLTDFFILRLNGSNNLQRVEVNNNGIFANQRSVGNLYLTRRDELYLNYIQTVTTAGVIDNLVINEDTKLIRFTASTEINGIVPSTTINGRLIRIYNASLLPLSINDNGESSLAANRFGMATTHIIPSLSYKDFTYIDSRWRVSASGLDYEVGARIVSSEVIITSDIAGTITANWFNNVYVEYTLTDAALVFAGTPATGNFRWDLVELLSNGNTNVNSGEVGLSAVRPTPTPDALIAQEIIWNDAGKATIVERQNNDTKNVWSTLRFSTQVNPGTEGKFAKIWEGNLSKDQNFAIQISYNDPKNAVNFSGSGAGQMKASWTCDNTRNIISNTVKFFTDPGSLDAEYRLVQLSGGKAALYHKSSHYWGRVDFRIVFQSTAVRLGDFVNDGVYGSAPSAISTWNSQINGGLREKLERESNIVLFDRLDGYIIGNEAARSGDILFDFTNAKLGSETEMRHNDASAFIFPVQCKLMFDVAGISNTQDNFFLFVLTNKTPGSEVVKVFHAIEGGI
jgi:hypothetical protein